MRSAFSKIFWGYLMTLLEIHIQFIDILPDPIGYLLIFLGIQSIVEKYPIGNKAQVMAAILGVISIPTVFINESGSMNPMEAPFTMWWFYSQIMMIANLVLIFFIFQLMLKIVQDYQDEELETYTWKFFKVYMWSNLALLIFDSFFINLSSEVFVALTVAAVVFYIILDIMFLVLLRKYIKLEDTPPTSPEEEPINTEKPLA
ncbi:hypothetical protein [Pontibacillus marinus]|uniref:Uncharacterized protein n=1 Tax=Pontibacillus marinus BH030004 = DSM 16465 TaxID=1385511 RepID=A0A0A5GD56_9BACI|nr:hypothetical protein [Pontibacillus marinus]KGX89944.1 hypothetical protein N783_03355 [Pontibacillus marinus BH030004 = DSM 16465]